MGNDIPLWGMISLGKAEQAFARYYVDWFVPFFYEKYVFLVFHLLTVLKVPFSQGG
jgi:hypothetical protein